MLADVVREGVEAFQRYEAAVLPMLERHDGRLERRLRTADGQAELHIVSFRSRSAYEAYSLTLSGQTSGPCWKGWP